MLIANNNKVLSCLFEDVLEVLEQVFSQPHLNQRNFRNLTRRKMGQVDFDLVSIKAHRNIKFKTRSNHSAIRRNISRVERDLTCGEISGELR